MRGSSARFWVVLLSSLLFRDRVETSRQMNATHKVMVTRSSTPRMTPIMIPVCLAANTSVYNRSRIHQVWPGKLDSFTDSLLLPCIWGCNCLTICAVVDTLTKSKGTIRCKQLEDYVKLSLQRI